LNCLGNWKRHSAEVSLAFSTGWRLDPLRSLSSLGRVASLWNPSKNRPMLNLDADNCGEDNGTAYCIARYSLKYWQEVEIRRDVSRLSAPREEWIFDWVGEVRAGYQAGFSRCPLLTVGCNHYHKCYFCSLANSRISFSRQFPLGVNLR
jgi:hypothetical protein